MNLGETYDYCRRRCRRRDVLSGFRKNYLLAEKSAGDGAAAMVELISWTAEGEREVDGLFDG